MAPFGYKTDIGKRRNNNEDNLLVLPRLNIYAVADGVGGLNSGEIASRNAMRGVESFILANPLSGADNLDGKYRENWLKSYFTRCIQKVNSEIIKTAAENPEFAQMATTIVICYLDMESFYIVNIGDSRAYILRDEHLTQLSVDHTYVNNLISAGTLTESEARIHPKKNMITKALGSGRNVEPDFFRFDLHDNDRILLCTDGLHGELTDDEITAILLGDEDLNTICKKLVDAANKKGGRDNITVVCIDNEE